MLRFILLVSTIDYRQTLLQSTSGITMHRIKSLFLAFLVIAFSLAVPLQVFAAPYGECGYGEGEYNEGCSPTPEPTPTSQPSSGSSGSTGSSGGSSDSQCSASKPSAAPDLFQINARTNSLTLFFAPVPDNRDRYYVSYGTEPGVYKYGFEFENNENGVISVDVSALAANTAYYFKVRAGNGCMPGDWSNEMAARTGQRFPSYRWSSLPRIVSTGVTRQVRPSAIQNVEVDSSKTTTLPTPAPTQQPTQPAQETASQPSSPSFFGKIGNFFKGIFGK